MPGSVLGTRDLEANNKPIPVLLVPALTEFTVKLGQKANKQAATVHAGYFSASYSPHFWRRDSQPRVMGMAGNMTLHTGQMRLTGSLSVTYTHSLEWKDMACHTWLCNDCTWEQSETSGAVRGRLCSIKGWDATGP